MSRIEYLYAMTTEYGILKKNALKVEDWFLAEYYDSLIKETKKELSELEEAERR